MPLEAANAFVNLPAAAGEQCAMHSCVGTLQLAGTCLLKYSFPWEFGLYLIIVSWTHMSQPSNRLLDWFSRFCIAHPNRHADRHTDHPTCDKPHLYTACRRCWLKRTCIWSKFRSFKLIEIWADVMSAQQCIFNLAAYERQQTVVCRIQLILAATIHAQWFYIADSLVLLITYVVLVVKVCLFCFWFLLHWSD